MEFTDGALQAIAHKAMGLDTGARALRSVVEDLMLDLMYELPEVDTAGKRYVITEDAVDSPENLTLLSALVEKKGTRDNTGGRRSYGQLQAEYPADNERPAALADAGGQQSAD